MNISDKIRSAGVDCSIVYEERLNTGTQMLCGQILYDNCVIKLEPNIQSEQGKHQTLLHEILHGISHYYNISCEADEKQ